MIDTQTPGSPGWWFKRLADRQLQRLSHLDRLSRYATGDHDLPEGDHNVREAFQRFQKRARSNYTGLVVESVLERLRPTGFRAGSGASAQDDKDAWRIWQANHLDADFPLVARAALSMGESYMMVGPPSQLRGGLPLITPEDPRQIIAEFDPIDKRRPIAALKIVKDSVTGQWKALLMLPTRLYSYTAPSVEGAGIDMAFGAENWSPAGDVENPLNRPPVVRFPNRLDLTGAVMAEFEDVIDVQDRINNEILNRLVISKMQAYRQRWITGAAFEDEDGNPIEPFKPGVDLVWAVEDENAKFGEFQQADLRQVIEAVSADVKDLAAITRTPPHYLLSEFVNASGDAFSQSETGHVAKCTERMAHFGEALEDVIRLAYAYMGDARANAYDSEVIWADPQYRSLAEKADAAAKLVAAGVPWRTVMSSVLGYTPQEIDRMDAERTSDALLASMTAPTPAPTPTVPQTGTEGNTQQGA